jgi:hypothetical protein
MKGGFKFSCVLYLYKSHFGLRKLAPLQQYGTQGPTLCILSSTDIHFTGRHLLAPSQLQSFYAVLSV